MPFGEKVLEDFVEDEPAGLVVALALLVLDDPALVIELGLGDRAEQIAHPVAFHEQCALERPGRNRLEIIGAVEIGGAVVIGRADLLQIFEIVARQVFRPVEHQMLEQMGEAGLALRLVLGTDIVPHRDADHRRLAVGVNEDGQAVGELELLVRDGDLADQRRDRRRLGRRGDKRRDCAGGGAAAVCGAVAQAASAPIDTVVASTRDSRFRLCICLSLWGKSGGSLAA
jgi:hypothetical protein